MHNNFISEWMNENTWKQNQVTKTHRNCWANLRHLDH